MRRQEFYIRHDFSYFDSGLLAVIPPQVLQLYDLLRRYVWRSENHGAPEVRELLRQGVVVAHIRQSTLATALGYTRRQTICENMAKLRELGWVKTQVLADSQTACFVLGQTVRDEDGRRHEVFFQDAILADLAEHLDTIAQKTSGDEDATLLALPMEDRIEATRAFLAACVPSGGPVREPVPALHGGPDRPRPGMRTQEVGSFGTSKEEGTSEIEVAGGSAPLRPLGSSPRGEGGRERDPRNVGGDLPRGRALQGSQDSSLGLEEEEPGDPDPEVGTPTGSAPPPPAPRRGTRATAVLDPERARELREKFHRTSQALAGQQIRELDVAAGRATTLKEGKQRSLSTRGLLAELEGHWLSTLRARHPGITFAPWGVKEKAKVDVLLKGYGEIIAKQILVYAVEKWDDIVKTRFKGKPTTLSLALVVGMHESLSMEAQTYARVAQVEARVNEWYREHPEESLPEALAEEYARVRS